MDDPVSFVDHNGLKEKKVWQKPGFLQTLFPLYLLQDGHPYKECKREELILNVRERAGHFAGATRVAIETPGIPYVGPTKQHKDNFLKNISEIESTLREDKRLQRKDCTPVYNGSIYKN